MRRALLGALATALAAAAPAPPAHAAGGLSITPETIEHSARRGRIGTMTVTNTTKETLTVNVRVRPWRQNRSTWAVSADLRSTYSRYVRATTPSFALPPGSRTVSLTVRRMPPGGSLFGGIEVFARPRDAKSRTGIVPQYRVVGRLRLNPVRPRPRLRAGAVDVVGRGAGRTLILAVRNLGNTLDKVGGTVTLTGPTRRTATVAGVGVVPRQVVYLKGASVSGMRPGAYAATWSLTQGRRHYTVRRTLRF